MIEIKDLDDNKIYNYLGYKQGESIITDHISSLVQRAKEEVISKSEPRAIFSRTIPISHQENKLYAENILLEGEDIKAHLESCWGAIFMATTIGEGIDRLIRTQEARDMTYAVILDSCSSVMVEAVADYFEKEKRDEIIRRGEYLTSRYSSGYGDFPISFNSKLMAILDAQRKIGLSVTDSGIMLPRKSISGVYGVSKVDVKGKMAGCKSCALRDKCLFRRENKSCGDI